MQSKRFLAERRGMCVLTALLTGMAASTAVGQQIIRVDGDVAVGGNGTSWPNAYKYLQDALANALEGDEIWVAAATDEYFVDQDAENCEGTADRRATFLIDKDIELYGGFNGTEIDVADRDPANNVTVLSGIINLEVLSPEPGCGDHGQDCQAAVDAGIATLSCCQAVCNLDPACCTGLWDEVCQEIADAHPCCGPAVHVVTFGADTTAAAVIDGFTIQNGRANRGGGQETDGNNGAGMLVYGSPTVSRCIFTLNIATGSGAGVMSLGQDEFPTFSNCVFHTNNIPIGTTLTGTHAGGFSSHLSNPTLTNCLFYNNESVGVGGAIYIAGGTCEEEGEICSEVTLVNCTIANNSTGANFVGGGIFAAMSTDVTIDNCILYDNRTDMTEDEAAQLTLNGVSDVDYCCIEGLDVFDTGTNIGDDPEFVDPAAADYRLDHTSPCIDVGNPDDTIIPDDLLDIDDNGEIFEPMPELDLMERVQGCVVDMGSYEFETCIGDIDDDCEVDSVDLIWLLGSWGSCVGCAADLDCDGDVDPSDLILFLGNWGHCDCSDEPGTPPTLQEAFEDACLDWPDDWNDVKDALGTEDQDNYLCWLDHYLNHCTNCFCPHAGSIDCSDDDPFD